MNPENDDEYVKAVLLAAHERGFTVHEEKGAPRRGLLTGGEAGDDGRWSRFTFILTDGRLISTAQFYPRREALSVTCRALEPWLEKFEVRRPRLDSPVLPVPPSCPSCRKD